MMLLSADDDGAHSHYHCQQHHQEAKLLIVADDGRQDDGLCFGWFESSPQLKLFCVKKVLVFGCRVSRDSKRANFNKIS